MKKIYGLIGKFFLGGLIFLFCVMPPRVALANSATSKMTNHMQIELYEKDKNKNSSLSGNHQFYPKTGEIQVMGYAFVGTSFIVFSLFVFFEKRRKHDEES